MTDAGLFFLKLIVLGPLKKRSNIFGAESLVPTVAVLRGECYFRLRVSSGGEGAGVAVIADTVSGQNHEYRMVALVKGIKKGILGFFLVRGNRRNRMRSVLKQIQQQQRQVWAGPRI